MSDTIRTVTTEAGEVAYDSDMPIGALEDLMAASGGANLGAIRTALSSFVVSWPYAGDPSDPEAWKGLRRSEFGNLTEKLMEDLGSLGN